MNYVSYFGGVNMNDPILTESGFQLISIATRQPEGFNIREAPALKPLQWMVGGLKKGRFSQDHYHRSYVAKVLKNVTPGLIAEMYPNSIFLCYEKPGEFCHRNIVSEWMRCAGFPCSEYHFAKRNIIETDAGPAEQLSLF